LRAPHAIVVGAGIGGLTAALELAGRDFDVTVCEAGSCAGGKIRQECFNGFRPIDCGPTVFTMRWIFDELLEAHGLDLEEMVDLKPLDLLARHAWPDGASLDLFRDEAASVEAITRMSGSAEGQRYRDFCQIAQTTFETLDRPFMRATRPNMAQLMARIIRQDAWGATAIHPFRSLWSQLGRHFHDPRLRQLFGRYATYCGSSPFQAPGTLMLIAHAERLGVWVIDGGMKRLATAIADAAQSRGVTFRYNCAVDAILSAGRTVRGVQLAGGETISADVVVFAGDCNALASGSVSGVNTGGLNANAGLTVRRAQRSQSAVTWTLVGEATGYDLAPHTVFFGSDYKAEFDAVFRDTRLPAQPTTYIHAPDRPLDGTAVDSNQPERLFLLVNAPADGDDPAPCATKDLERCQKNMLDLMTSCGLNLRWQAQHVVRATPQTFAQRFPGTGGALYGRASHGWRASFQRAGSRGPLKGLYLAGGSVHPGPGVPMAALSGRLAAACVLKDFRLQTRLHPAATIGGTLTA